MAHPDQISSRSPNPPDSNQRFHGILMEIVGPILIMLMVGALVFFLIEVFYRGPHALRLGWVLGLFTAASVLVARISIMEGLERASLFGFALAAATLYATVTLVDFEYGALFFLEPVVVVMLIAVVMWSTNRLTWDCTLIDGSRDVSAIGLTELVKRRINKTDRARSHQQRQTRNGRSRENNAAPTLARRWQFFLFANTSNQNTPGLWVFYFALAAFPIFGFGQLFSQPDSSWGYRWIFMLFAIYLGSALGLLMLTSLLGLERYLQKRGASMPNNVAVNWMTVGTAFAALMMLIVLLLPSPSLSNGLENALAFLTTHSKETSAHAVGNDGQPNDEKAKKQVRDPEAKGAQQKPGKQGTGKGDQGKGGDQQSKARGKDSSSDQKTNARSENQQNSNSSENSDSTDSNRENRSDDQSSQRSESNGDKQERNEKSNSQDQSSRNQSGQDGSSDDQDSSDDQPAENDDPSQKDPNPPENDQAQQNDQRNRARQDADPAKQDNDQEQERNRKRGANGNAPPPPPNNSAQPSRLVQSLSRLMKYIVYGIGLIVLIVALWMFRHELAKLWAELFGKKDDRETPENKSRSRKLPAKPLPRFSAFKNPFASGQADQWPGTRTIEYSFQALEAWARDHGQPRGDDQTLIEFSRQLQIVNKDVASQARRLADLMGECLYSGGYAVSPAETQKLQELWQSMGSHPPMSQDPVTVTASA